MIAIIAIAAALVGVHFAFVSFAAAAWLGLLASLLVTGLLVKLAHWLAFPSRDLPENRVRHMRIRIRLGARPGPGHATWFEAWFRWGRLAAYRRSGRARPSLNRWQRYRCTAGHSFQAGRAYRLWRLLVPSEEHAVLMAPPRTRKTGLLAKILLTWPGPAVATSTKPDLFALTSGVHQAAGRPIYVFNPQGIGGLPSTFGWNPLDGCDVQSVAIRRADLFAHALSQKGVEDGGWWASKASDYLRAYFHAAALGGYSLLAVAHWVTNNETGPAEDILHQHGRDDWADQLTELRGEAAKTSATIRMSMSRALQFLADPLLAQSVVPQPGYDLDIAEFLSRNGILYLIAEASGSGEEAPVSALFACLAGEIRYQAALAGSSMPGARLDPPLLMAMDEATQICPCPIPSWLADSGGKGITFVTVTHGEAQLEARWGPHGKQTILDTSGVKIWLPGIMDTGTLDTAEKLCGDTAYTEHGQQHSSRHPVMTDAMIRQIPRGYALILRGDLSPVIAHVPVAWWDWRYLWAKVRGRGEARITAAPLVVATYLNPARPGGLAPWPPEGAPPAPPSAEGADHPWNRPPAKPAGPGNGHRGGNGHGGPNGRPGRDVNGRDGRPAGTGDPADGDPADDNPASGGSNDG